MGPGRISAQSTSHRRETVRKHTLVCHRHGAFNVSRLARSVAVAAELVTASERRVEGFLGEQIGASTLLLCELDLVRFAMGRMTYACPEVREFIAPFRSVLSQPGMSTVAEFIVSTSDLSEKAKSLCLHTCQQPQHQPSPSTPPNVSLGISTHPLSYRPHPRYQSLLHHWLLS